MENDMQEEKIDFSGRKHKKSKNIGSQDCDLSNVFKFRRCSS